MRLTILSVALAICAASLPAAAECNPAEILRENSDVAVFDRYSALAFLQSSSGEMSSTTRGRLSATIPVEGLPAVLNGSSLRSYAGAVRRVTQINYTQQEHAFLARRALAQGSVEAYLGCLRTEALRIEFPSDPREENRFPLTVEWDPRGPSENSGQMTVTVLNGDVAADGVSGVRGPAGESRIEVNVLRGSALDFTVYNRDLSGPTFLTVTVRTALGVESRMTHIPRRMPSFQVVLEPVRSASVQARSRGDERITPTYVDPRNGGFLLLETAQWRLTRQTPRERHRTRYIIEPEPRSSPVRIHGHLWADGNVDNTSEIAGRIEALQLRVIPELASPP